MKANLVNIFFDINFKRNNPIQAFYTEVSKNCLIHKQSLLIWLNNF